MDSVAGCPRDILDKTRYDSVPVTCYFEGGNLIETVGENFDIQVVTVHFGEVR